MNRIGYPNYDMPMGYKKPKGIPRLTMADKKKAVFNLMKKEGRIAPEVEPTLADMFRRYVAA